MKTLYTMDDARVLLARAKQLADECEPLISRMEREARHA